MRVATSLLLLVSCICLATAIPARLVLGPGNKQSDHVVHSTQQPTHSGALSALEQTLLQTAQRGRELLGGAGIPEVRGDSKSLVPGFRNLNNIIRNDAEEETRVVLPEKPANRQPGCKKLMWFTAVSGREGKIPSHYATFIIPVLLSALRKAPSLVPNLIYDGPMDQPVIKWWVSMGGIVHHHNLSIYEDLKSVSKFPYHPPGFITLSGAFLRFDIPELLREYEFPPDVESEYVLYTDVDSLFLKDIDSCSFPPTKVFAMGPEGEKGAIINAGVMYINIKGFDRHRQGFFSYGREHHWPMVQPILLGYFKDRKDDKIDGMEDRFNWKGYWGKSDDAVIIHFHGPKPGVCVECYLLHLNDLQYCAKKYHHCEVYMNWWNKSPDGGQYFFEILQQFYLYIGLATTVMV